MRLKAIYLALILILPIPVGAWTHMGSNRFGWNTKKLEFYINPAGCTISESELNAVVDRALEAWNRIPSIDLELVRAPVTATDTEAQFRAGTATQLPLVVCSTQLSNYQGVDANTTLAFVPFFQVGSAGHVTYSGLVLNAQAGAAAELSQYTTGEMELIVGHEIGHVLGLGHSSDKDALMYYQLNKPFLLITRDDQDGMAQLYPSNIFGSLLGCAAIHEKETELPLLGLSVLIGTVLMLLLAARWWFNIEPLPLPEE